MHIHIIYLLISGKLDSVRQKELATFKANLEYTRNTLNFLESE
jgi:hypothetical protein